MTKLSKAAAELLEKMMAGEVSVGRDESLTKWMMVCGREILADVTAEAGELLAPGLVVGPHNWLILTDEAIKYAAREARIAAEAGAMYAIIKLLADRLPVSDEAVCEIINRIEAT